MITIAIDEVRETAIEMLDELAATTPLVPASGAAAATDAELVSISIDIIGPIVTTMVLQVGAGDATRLAASMLGEAAENLEPSDVDETMAELANVIGGGVKGLVADETHLGIPTSARVPGPLGVRPLSSVIEHELGRFEVGLVDSED